MLHDYLDDGRIRYRIVGTAVQEMFGYNPVGSDTGQRGAVTDSQIDFHRAIVKANMKTGMGLVITRSVLVNEILDWHYKTLSLPLVNDQGDVRHGIIGCMLIAPPRLEGQNQSYRNYFSRSFRIEDTRILEVQRVDIGCGVADFGDALPKNVTLLPTIAGGEIYQCLQPDVVTQVPCTSLQQAIAQNYGNRAHASAQKMTTRTPGTTERPTQRSMNSSQIIDI